MWKNAHWKKVTVKNQSSLGEKKYYSCSCQLGNSLVLKAGILLVAFLFCFWYKGREYLGSRIWERAFFSLIFIIWKEKETKKIKVQTSELGTDKFHIVFPKGHVFIGINIYFWRMHMKNYYCWGKGQRNQVCLHLSSCLNVWVQKVGRNYERLVLFIFYLL